MRLAAGTRVQQYELIRELGRGGMGQVFLASDTRLGRRVAMKFLASDSRRFTERFLTEARATARCSHDHIVVIHDVGSYQGLPYMVLEYLEGPTLGKVIEDKRLPVGRTVELVVPIVKALVRAHEFNIVHRDLKPDNVIVTASGGIKVLDFGIAKLYSAAEAARQSGATAAGGALGSTRAGALIGTLPDMSPEQLAAGEVDHQSDIWAVGIMLYEMLAGKHPLAPVTQARLFGAAAKLDEPMPPLGPEVPDLPDRLDRIVKRCLAKRKDERFATAAELCGELESLLPGRSGRNLVADESPYPGLNAFQESDSNRFYGRAQDVTGVMARLRDQPLVGVVGPSGVGKSSLIRAGVVPAMKGSGESWEVLIVRPGRHPFAALASALEPLRASVEMDAPVVDDLAGRLRREPGTLGALLRARARRHRSQILLYVDQHEELYTLVSDAAERLAFTASLAGAADDASGPLRVIVAMRSDFLDRAAEDRHFVAELTRGLVFLQPPSRAGLEEALTLPLEMLGYGFESPEIVQRMLETLEATPGSLPLMQFTAAKLWETRDRKRQVLTNQSYQAMGGVAGALATHADEVLAGLAQPDQKLVRALFQRLVTPERTRAIVNTSELHQVSPEMERLIGHLVGARLLVVQSRGELEGSAVEIVHESLIKSWPTLRRWLDENHEDAAFLAQLGAAAKQWVQKGRPQGLLWRGEAMEEARLWRARYRGDLPARDEEYLRAVIALANRASRIKRAAVAGTIAFLLILVAAGGAALVSIRTAEQKARNAEQKAIAEAETAKEALKKSEEEKKMKEAAQVVANEATERATTQTEKLSATSRDLEKTKTIVSRKDLELQKKRAEADRERRAAEEARQVAAKVAEEKRKEEARKAEERRKIANDL